LVDREILATRLSKLRVALRRLDPIAKKTREDYLCNETDRALAEHFLRIALEAALDTGNHIVASKGFRKPLKLRDIFLILGENGLISGELALKLARATGLRNRLVHGYSDIDHNVLYDVLQQDLRDLEEFAVAVGKSLDPEE
jgi:uncharacterized protein YutE (UPF0331/DUF86 family)